MKKLVVIVATLMIVAVAMIAQQNLSFIGFFSATVGNSAETSYNWAIGSGSALIVIYNDGLKTVYVTFDPSGAVDTGAGKGGGIILTTEKMSFPVRTTHLGLKCAGADTSAVRVWVYGQ